MNCSEEALVFECAGEALVGILALPAAVSARSEPPALVDRALIVVVGGPQYRAGSHRQFTMLARALAESGWPVLRFDYRGMGDSTGAMRAFEGVTEDIGAAIDALQARLPGVRHVVLWGLCDGASAALLYLHETSDPRVCALSLVNPWVRSEAMLARAHFKNYYLQRLRQPEFWRKMTSGRAAATAAAELWRNLGRSLGRASDHAKAVSRPVLTYQDRMAEVFGRFEGPVMLVLSGKDLTASEFVETVRADPAWRCALGRGNVERFDFDAADHTFSAGAEFRRLSSAIAKWLGELARLPSPEATATPSTP